MAEPSSAQISSLPCHLSGNTKLCFSPDGSTVFTGGSDCLVRIHKADEPDSEPGFHDDHTDEITSLTCSGKHLVTGCKDNIARYFSYPENNILGFVTRGAGVPIRWVSLDKAGERVAVCSDDLLVKIVNMNDTSRVQMISDNAKSVRSATWDPTGKYMTSACCDGKIKVYDMSGSTPLNVKILEGLLAPSEPDSESSCYVAWHPSGAYFAVPLRTNDIGIISRDNWQRQTPFSHEGHKSVVSELAWSPNGKYLASSSLSFILIWSTETKSVISKYTVPEGSVSGLAWSPKKNLLAFTSLDGSFHRWNEPVSGDLPSPIKTEEQVQKKLDRLLDDDFGGDDDEDMDMDMENKGEDLDDDVADDWIVDDEGGGVGVYGKDDDERKFSKGRTEVVNVTKAQEPFAPGSTLMKNKKRYLAFNMIGVVDVTDQDTHHVINVEFHDKSARRGYHFQDHSKYFTASLGEQGVAFAATSDGETPSQVYYRPYDSWASSSDWTISLLPGEEAVLVAAGGNPGDGMASVVVATTRGYLRFLSGTGIQRYMWRIGEDVVSLAAGREAVTVIHREGGTSLDGCQNLKYTIFDLDSFDIIQEGRIPLPKKITLIWTGFTAEGVPAIYDSSGLLSILDRFRRPHQARWVPLMDTSILARREGKVENYWPVGVTEKQFACVILKGSEKEPWFPRPLVQEIEIHMPLLGLENQQGKLEESVVRGEVQLSLMRDLEQDEPTLRAAEVALDKELLQLVQAACKADSLSRALDIARLMHNPGSIDAAAKIAGFYHLPGLQERMGKVKGEMELRKRRLEVSRRSRKSEGIPTLPPPMATSNGHHHATSGNKFSDFAPRGTAPRRSFGGVAKDRAETPVASSSVATGRETYIPETPYKEDELSFSTSLGENATLRGGGYGSDDESGERSPDGKRKRDENGFNFETSAPVGVKSRQKADLENGANKNPFAKRAAAGSNPFAKAAVAKPLDAIKSTSFFDRVDDIESSGIPKPKKQTKASKDAKVNGASGKQTTLMGMKKVAPPPKPIHHDSMTSMTSTTSTDTEETQLVEETPPVGILEESMVQETVGSPEWQMEEEDE